MFEFPIKKVISTANRHRLSRNKKRVVLHSCKQVRIYKTKQKQERARCEKRHGPRPGDFSSYFLKGASNMEKYWNLSDQSQCLGIVNK